MLEAQAQSQKAKRIRSFFKLSKKPLIFVFQLFEAFLRKVAKVKSYPSPTPSEKSFQKITTDRQHEQSQKEVYSTWESTGKETHRHKSSTSNNFQL